MEIKIGQTELMKGLQIVHSAIAAKTTLPVLSNVLLETVKKKKIRLTATDLEVGLQCLISAEVVVEGGITIPGRKFYDIVRELPAETIHLIRKNKGLTIDCKRSYFQLTGMEKEDFPKFPTLQKKSHCDVPEELLKKMIRKTIFAASHDENRYVLNGLYLSLDENKLILVGTDGRRLARSVSNIDLPKGFKRDLIIPNKALHELSKVLDGGDKKEVKMLFGENEAAFETGNIVLVTRLIEGKFPSYERVIPEKCAHRVKVEREILLAALRRVSLLTSERSTAVRFAFGQGKLVASANTPEIGEAKEELEIEYEGSNETISFNPAYIIDFLKNEDDEEIYFEFNNHSDPGVIRPVGDEKYLYVIMPMKV